jgi:hypothetical protein
VFAKLAGMTQESRLLITRDDRHVVECCEGGRTGIAEAVVLERGQSGNAATVGWRWRNGVEVPATIATKNHAPRLLVLNRKIQSVKVNRTGIVASELANKKKIPGSPNCTNRM